MKNKNKPDIEVFITGMGIVTALGAGIQSHLQAVRQSRTGLTIQSFFNKTPPDPFPCGLVPTAVLPCSVEESASNRANLLFDSALQQALSQAKISLPL